MHIEHGGVGGAGGAHEVVEAEVLTKGQIENAASHGHEFPATMADVGAAAKHRNRLCE
jgi:hypothetical protein